MRKNAVAGLVSLLVALSTSMSAMATGSGGKAVGLSENWQQIGHDETPCDYFFDPHTLSSSPDGKNGWFMRSCGKPQGKQGHQFRSSVFAVSFHCEDHTSAITQMVTYSKPFGTGTPVDSNTMPAASKDYSSSPPGTMGETWQVAARGKP